MLAHSSPEDFLRSIEDAKSERRRQKDVERSLETRVLQPWERYRALVDHYDALQDLSEQNDRKTRFALLILGSLNALNLAIAMRSESIGVSAGSGGLVIVYLAAYALVSLACCFCAIAALRPRTRETASGRGLNKPLLSHAASQSLDEYCNSWRTAEIGALTREMASLVYGAVRNNEGKLRSLHRVYIALYLLVVLTAGLVSVLAWAGLSFPVF
jgi:hypothetical protein